MSLFLSSYLPLNCISARLIISLLEVITDSTAGQVSLERVLWLEKIQGLWSQFVVTVMFFLLRNKNTLILLSKILFFVSLLFVAPHRRKWNFIELHHYHITFGCGVQNRCENLVTALTVPLPGNLRRTHFT